MIEHTIEQLLHLNSFPCNGEATDDLSPQYRHLAKKRILPIKITNNWDLPTLGPQVLLSDCFSVEVILLLLLLLFVVNLICWFPALIRLLFFFWWLSGLKGGGASKSIGTLDTWSLPHAGEQRVLLSSSVSDIILCFLIFFNLLLVFIWRNLLNPPSLGGRTLLVLTQIRDRRICDPPCRLQRPVALPSPPAAKNILAAFDPI